jgi:hypothetical protein
MLGSGFWGTTFSVEVTGGALEVDVGVVGASFVLLLQPDVRVPIAMTAVPAATRARRRVNREDIICVLFQRSFGRNPTTSDTVRSGRQTRLRIPVMRESDA